jgi:hypothetical protein
MDKEIIKEELKTEVELFKIYTLILIGLVTGNVSLSFKIISEKEIFVSILLIVGIIALLSIFVIFVRSYFRIIKNVKKLKKC